MQLLQQNPLELIHTHTLVKNPTVVPFVATPLLSQATLEIIKEPTQGGNHTNVTTVPNHSLITDL